MIGIFDSGSGGLTVLRAVRKQMPSCDVMYFGDIKNAPYGEKSREELSRLTINSIRVLQARGATSIVSACNSVSASLAVSLFDILGLAQQNLIEMVGPTVSCFADFKKPILLVATPATISSGIYQNAFQMLGIMIDTIAIPKLAGAIEFGVSAMDQERLIAAAFAPYDLKKYGTLILACTHYPLALASFRKVLGDVPFFDPAEAVADRVKRQLWPREVGDGKLRLLVSRDTPQFRSHVAKLLPDATYIIEVLGLDMRMEYKVKKVHFIGIGGIGMSALAQYYKDQGMTVIGSDRDPSPKVHEMLTTYGISIVVGHSPDNVPPDVSLVVYSDAVPEDNPERERASELGIPQKSYFEMLGEVSKNKKTIAVAGTHGKTTTTGMLAKILGDAGASPTAIVGSIVKDCGSNYLHGDSDLFVVEACEYKDHLLELSPQILVITNLEWDHTDYFPSLEALQETFRKAIESIPTDGAIVTDPSNPNIAPLLAGAKAKVIDYTKEPSYKLRLPGEFNQNNARAAASAARVVLDSVQHRVLDKSDLSKSLASFQGTWRRFEYKGKNRNGADVYDDYAHHPTAVRETLKALRGKVKGKIIVAFHPHLYSRTRDLLDEFAHAFIDADTVFIAPIYPAREVDDGSISSEILAERIRATGVEASAFDFDGIEKELNKIEQGDTIITMGAGDIYKIADALVAHI